MQPKTASGFGVRKLRPSGYCRHLQQKLLLFTMLLWALGAFSPPALLAQCQLSCRGKINISLGDSCRAELLPAMLLTGGPSNCPGARFRVDVLDHYMQRLPSSPYVTGDLLYKEVLAMVYDSTSRNSCWSKVLVEDKFGPVIDCRMDTIYCNDTMAMSTPAFYDNCDPNPTIEFLGEEIDPYPCDPQFIKKITRYWRGRDNLGNLSPICSSMFWLRRIPIDSVEYPKNFVSANNCSLECNSGYATDANGHPHPSVTGAPNIDGMSLWPSYLFYCNLSTSYEDAVILDLPCKKKILRLWRVVEWWCNSAVVRTHPQTIEIIDSEPPTVHCPYDFTVTTAGGYLCQARVFMPPIPVNDNCQDTIVVDMHYPGGIRYDANGGYIDLVPGENDVVYHANDRCYNESTCTVRVTVFDRTPPVAVCQQNTVVTLTADDLVRIPATVFDDGSYDDCHIDSFFVRRMDDGEPCNFRDTFFRPFVEFCCEDAGEERMVILRVVDKHGNFNDCMVNVEIQDKTPPVINCPHDHRIVCTDHNDTIDLSHFGEADYYDNCVVHMHQYVDSFLNQCGLGHIERVFVVRDNMDRTDTCRQRIDIYDADPFDEGDIIWPLNYHTEGCGVETDPRSLPEENGYPRFYENDCSLIAVAFEDEKFNYIQDTAVCFKILRTWKVIDWCQCYYDHYSGQTVCPEWIHQQVIKVSNRVAPKVQDNCDRIRLCISDQECLRERIRLSHTAKDDCTPDELLRHSFKIDLYDDGYFDSIYAGLGANIQFDGELPLGNHRILWIWEDQCGNLEVCTQFVDILNCKAPTAYCLSGINVNIMAVDTNQDGRLEKFIDIWSNDVDKGSYQFCGNPVVTSFSSDTFHRFLRYTCDSLGMHRVAMWVTDRLTGLQDLCYTTITIQDNNNVCNTGNFTADVGGLLITPYDQPVPGVSIVLEGSGGTIVREFSGKFQFDQLRIGDSYRVKAQVDKNYVDGVSTLDIVKLQRHILGVESFPTPWHYLAGDVNGDKRVSAADVSAIRKLVLGIDARYKNALSWKFVEANYRFPVADDPWYEPFAEEYIVSGLAGDMMYLDFRGVKVGDVSQSTWNGLQGWTERATQQIALRREWLRDEGRVAVVAEQSMDLRGLQMTLCFDPGSLPVQGVSPGALPLGSENAGWSQADRGYLLLSWSDAGEVHIPAGAVLFYLDVDHTSALTDVRSLTTCSDVLTAEAYTAAGDIAFIDIRDAEGEESHGFYCSDPVPNPFSRESLVRYYAPRAGELNYSIADPNGNIWVSKSENCAEGQNTLAIRREWLPGPGVYFLKVEAGNYVKSMKLVVIGN
ncbi:MAG: T9SS type A sorting domain-containing protein [Saprospiraceae bacterium]|nr:T9SS type A sorting domain-containing protein [Saprospiraceae bacterium]MBP9210347.1 T9SS type A sorting domain-containing protein [Saprospiraceae bacterium]